MAYIGKTPASAALTSSDISDGIIITDKLANNAVVTSKITDGTISNADISSTVITGQTAITSVANDDLVLISDTSGSAALKKMTVANLVANAGGGKILQVKSVTWDDAFSSTVHDGTYATITGATLAITPNATSSKIFFQAMITTGAQTYGQYIKIQRGGSDISGALGAVSGDRKATTGYSVGGTSDDAEMQSTYISYLDSPSSTSTLTYTLQGSSRHTGGWTVNYPYTDTNASYTGHSVSTITLMEVGA